MSIRPELGKADTDRVTIRSHDLCEDLLGSVGFADMVVLMLQGRLPGTNERTMIDALLVMLVEHGLVKPALVARMVYSNAPQSLQGAVAAALLGARSKHLGSPEECARMLVEARSAAGDGRDTPGIAADVVARYARERRYIPGIGHRTHAQGDPRAAKLFQIAEETGTAGEHSRLVQAVSQETSSRRGRLLPVNVTGAIAGIALDMGFRWEIVRGFALMGRTLGALAQVHEEIESPIAEQVKDLVLEAATQSAHATAERS